MSDDAMGNEQAGLSWEISLEQLRRDSERRAWRVAAGALCLSGLALTTLVLILPMKQTIPYLISVDRATGQNEVVSLASNQPTALKSIEAKFWLATYVRTRERIDRNWLRDDFASIIRWSDKNEGQIYANAIKLFLAADHASKAPPETRIEIVSIGLIDESHAVVRFVRIPVSSSAAPADAESRATATLVFSIKPPLTARERDLIENPLGFQVQSYRVDNDLVDLPGGWP